MQILHVRTVVLNLPIKEPERGVHFLYILCKTIFLVLFILDIFVCGEF